VVSRALARRNGEPRVQTLVVYDIASDKLRHRVAEACKDYGLQRIQWSAFLGDLTHNRRTELALRLQGHRAQDRDRRRRASDGPAAAADQGTRREGEVQ